MIAPERLNDKVRKLHDLDFSVWTYSFIDGRGKKRENEFYSINGFGIHQNAVADKDLNRTGEFFNYGVRNLHAYVNERYGYGEKCQNIEARVIAYTR